MAADRLRCLRTHLVPTASSTDGPPLGASALADIAAEFHNTGVVVLEGFFDAATLAPLNQAIGRLVASTQPWSADVAARRGQFKEKYKRLFETELVSLPFSAEHPDTAAELLADHRLRAVTAALLGSDYSEQGPMCFGYGSGMQHGWHQDSGSTDAGQFVLNRIVYPSTVREGQGALHFVPGSIHRHGGLVRSIVHTLAFLYANSVLASMLYSMVPVYTAAFGSQHCADVCS